MIKRIVVTLSVIGLATSTARAQKTPFAGQWKVVPAQSRMPDEMKVQSKGGTTYAFDFGGGAETIAVDGSDQPGVQGTLLSVKAEAPNTWIVRRKKGGRLLLSATWKLSDDGRTITDYFRGFGTDGSTQSVDYVYQRSGEGSGFAADWQTIKETINPPFVLEVKELSGDSLFIADPVEQIAKTVTVESAADSVNQTSNASRGISSSFRRVGERTLVVTDKFGGKTAVTEDFVLSNDLKMLTMTVHVVGRDKPDVLVFERN